MKFTTPTSVLITKHGVFQVCNNGSNGASIFVANVKVAEFPNVSWWNVDSLENAIEQNIDLIKKRIEERVYGKTELTKENASEVLERLVEVLGDEDKGFYKSRLNQCINRLKRA